MPFYTSKIFFSETNPKSSMTRSFRRTSFSSTTRNPRLEGHLRLKLCAHGYPFDVMSGRTSLFPFAWHSLSRNVMIQPLTSFQYWMCCQLLPSSVYFLRLCLSGFSLVREDGGLCRRETSEWNRCPIRVWLHLPKSIPCVPKKTLMDILIPSELLCPPIISWNP